MNEATAKVFKRELIGTLLFYFPVMIMIDKAKANKIAEEVLKDMVKSDNMPKKTLEILKILKLEKLQALRSW